jgi:hypothetical protein
VKTYSKVKHPNAAQISHHKLKTMNNTIIWSLNKNVLRQVELDQPYMSHYSRNLIATNQWPSKHKKEITTNSKSLNNINEVMFKQSSEEYEESVTIPSPVHHKKN